MRTQANFRLFGDEGLTSQAVTERLGIEPSRSHERGDPVDAGSTSTRSSCAWLLATEADETGTSLSAQIESLLDVLEPRSDALWDLVGDGYRASWFCIVASNADERAVALDRELLARLLWLPGQLLLDVGGD